MYVSSGWSRRQGVETVWGRCLFLLAMGVASYGFGFAAKVSIAPHNVLELTTEAINSATRSLYINIYEMKSKEIGDAIVKQIDNGLLVDILEEGQPVGGVSAAEKALQSKIVKAMVAARKRGRSVDHYFVMTSKASRTRRRFRYDHAKYVIVDDKALLIGSENFSENAKPTPAKPGNRGWEALLHDPSITKDFKKIFTADTDLESGDVMDISADDSKAVDEPALTEVLENLVPVLSDTKFPLPDNTTVDITSVESVFSPHSLSGLLQLMNGAQKTLQLEMMTFAPKWGKNGDVSPLLSGVEAAARRGVSVQVLLNDETAFSHQPKEDEGDGKGLSGHSFGRPGSSGSRPFRSASGSNVDTCDELNKVAESENLDLECRIASLEKMKVAYIHNKGVLVDGNRVLVSSINWNQNSVENNREAGVVLESEAVYQFYEPVFEKDWSVSESRRLSH